MSPKSRAFPLASVHYKYIYFYIGKEKNLKKERFANREEKLSLKKGNGDVLRGEELGRWGSPVVRKGRGRLGL